MGCRREKPEWGVGGTRWLLRLLLRRLDRGRLRFRGARPRLHCRCTWSRWLWRRDRPLLWGRRTRFLDCRHGGLCRRQGRGLGGRLGRRLRWSLARASSHLLRPRGRHVLGCRAGRGPLPRLLHPLAHLGRHLLRQARIDPAGLRVCLVDGCPVVRLGAAEPHPLPCPGRLLAAAQGVQRLPDLRPEVCGRHLWRDRSQNGMEQCQSGHVHGTAPQVLGQILVRERCLCQDAAKTRRRPGDRSLDEPGQARADGCEPLASQGAACPGPAQEGDVLEQRLDVGLLRRREFFDTSQGSPGRGPPAGGPQDARECLGNPNGLGHSPEGADGCSCQALGNTELAEGARYLAYDVSSSFSFRGRQRCRTTR